MKHSSILIFLTASLTLAAACSSYDDNELRTKIDNLDGRVSTLEKLCDKLNSDVTTLQSIVNALQNNDYVTSVTPVTENGRTGYTIIFSKSGAVTVYNGVDGRDGSDGANGKDGSDGKDGTSPVIGVKQDTDGIWYWTLNGQWLTDNGQKIQASATDGKDGGDGKDGKDGENGKDGKDGITPQLKIESGHWYISYDNGSTWTDLGKATGENGKDGDSLFKEVRQDDDFVYFELTDGTVITIPLESAVKFNIVFDSETVPILNAGESKTISYTITKATDETIVKTVVQNGWVATVNQKSNDSGEIIVQAPNPIVASEILVFASDGEGHTVMAALDCVKGQCTVAKSSYSVKADGGNVDLVVTTNMPYNIVIPTEVQSWISLKTQTKATVTETKTLVIGQNTEYQKRSAIVKLTDSEDNTIQTIEIVQEAAAFSGDLSITVTSAGTLKSVLSSYSYSTIKSISISGPLDDDDYDFIKNDLISLRRLDLSGAAGVEPNFKDHSSYLDLVILPSSLTSISAYAFSNANIIQIVLPENLQSIGDHAFYNCSKMTGAITIPKTVNYIGEYAFNGTKIESFTFADGVQITKIEKESLPSTITSLRIPALVASLDNVPTSNLKSLSFEEGSIITEIPEERFSRSSLASVSLPDACITIGQNAFYGCESLTSITIPKNVVTIGRGAFKDSGLKTVSFEPGSKLKTIEGYSYYSNPSTAYAFYGAFCNTSLEVLSIPENVLDIGVGAFAYCTKLKTIDFSLSKSLTTIGPYAFAYSGLQTLKIPATVENIEYGAFENCSSLVSVQFEPNSSLTKIGGGGSDKKYPYHGSFENCISLAQFTIPASVESIEARAFNGCSNMVNLSFEEGSKCKEILGKVYTSGSTYSSHSEYYGAFEGTKIQTLTLPPSLSNVSSYSLQDMEYLTTIKIEDGAQPTFSYNACYGCSQLSEIDASNASFAAAYSAFYYQPITIVKIGAINPPSCDSKAFGDVSKATLYVPAESIEYYKLEDGWNKFGTILSL